KWVEDFYDNTTGEISLVGGVPDPGYKTSVGGESALMATIVFSAKSLGTGTISFTNESEILSNLNNINILTIKRGYDVAIRVKPSPTPIPSISLNKKVLLVIYDPLLRSGQKLHTAWGWNDPQNIISQITSSIQKSSGGFLNYQIVETKEINDWPVQMGGVRGSEDRYNTCMKSSNKGIDCAPLVNSLDYAQLWSDTDICSKVSSGQIDEVFLIGFPYVGFDEFAFKIPGDQVPYNTPSDYWVYQGRKKNIPNCNGKTVFAMGFSYERGLAEALESYTHRIESALILTVGRGYWEGCNGNSDFDKFTCINKEITATSINKVAGCGRAHFLPNSLRDYDDANSTVVPNICSSFDSYPFTDPIVKNENCEAWGCSGVGRSEWLMRHLPKKEGITDNGNLKNWWKYIADFDNAVIEAKGSTSTPAPTCIPRPACLDATPPCLLTPPSEGDWCPLVSPTPVPRPKGDGNKDGKVNLIDMSVLHTDWKVYAESKKTIRGGIDMNDDGLVNVFDFGALRDLLINLRVIKKT
ncbi:hypothetical protein HYU95_04110, partial [Candidatus Daviesbacteria bacterium]|nr:hypothetical protein [Candidatus Daviesbacteria bacterium]